MEAFQANIESLERHATQVLGVGGSLAVEYRRARVAFLIDRKGAVRYPEKETPDNAPLLEKIEKSDG